MQEYLNTLDDNEIVCFIDAYDVILLRPLEELEQSYLKLYQENKKEIIIGHDKLLTLTSKFIIPLLFGQCMNKQINSGSYIGYNKYLKLVLKEIINTSCLDILDNKIELKDINCININVKADDQKLITEYCINNYNKFYIDETSK